VEPAVPPDGVHTPTTSDPSVVAPAESAGVAPLAPPPPLVQAVVPPSVSVLAALPAFAPSLGSPLPPPVGPGPPVPPEAPTEVADPYTQDTAAPPLLSVEIAGSALFPGVATGNGAVGVVPFTPFDPLPALNAQLSNAIVPVDDTTCTAMLEFPLFADSPVASVDWNVTFSNVIDAVTPFMTSADAPPGGPATFTVFDPGAYAHVLAAQENPPYTVALAAVDPRASGA
jgi:hypothetical protein